MNVFEETRNILSEYKIQANKNLGQNFLINENVIEEIINSAQITDNDLIIEIGPGLGVLTNRLLQKAYKVIAIELDNKMVEIINDRFKLYKNLKIINNDILKVNIQDLIIKEKTNAKEKGTMIENVKIVANLPYYISTPIIMKLLEDRLDISDIIIMVQKEVAQRITATPGTKLSGAITYAVDYYAETEKILEVSKESFIPSPKVESEVIRLKIRKKTKISIDNESKFFGLIKRSFSQRRKTLVNTLVNYNYIKDKEEAKEVIKGIGLDENVRGETLSLEQYKILYEKLN